MKRSPISPGDKPLKRTRPLCPVPMQRATAREPRMRRQSNSIGDSPNSILPEALLGQDKPAVTREQLDVADALGTPIRRATRRSGDSEIRFADAVANGPVPILRPDLGPCLIFLGSVNGKPKSGTGGYGQFRYGGRSGYAHRYAWEREEGPIPDGLTVDHLCRVRRCVRRSHLELVDGATNTRRGAASREVCRNGHFLVAGNIKPTKTGWECLICYIATDARSTARKRTARAARGNRRVKYDQSLVREQITLIREAQCTIVQAARVIGCNPNYLGRRAWQETRRDVLLRDGSCCRCGRSDVDLDAHHRHPRKVGGTSNPRVSFGMPNIIALCRPCHQYVESHREQARREGFLIGGEVARPEEVPVWRHLRRWAIPGDGVWIPSNPLSGVGP